MNKLLILAVLGLLGRPAFAQIREFQTPRLTSTAGAGVASILSTESALLNPAASAYFEGSSFSYVSYNTDVKNEANARSADPFPGSNKSEGAFMADHSGPVKGGIAYLRQDENNFERERAVFHSAAPIGKASSFGVSYSYIQDTLPRSHEDRHRVLHQTSFGATHIVDERTVLGIVIIDPTKATPGEERLIAGFQYAVADRFTLLGDVGTQYTKVVTEEYLWRAAAQMNVFRDFFLRFGRFYDSIFELKGYGWGAAWMGPRFGVEFGQKTSEAIASESYVYEDERVIDTSLSILIKF